MCFRILLPSDRDKSALFLSRRRSCMRGRLLIVSLLLLAGSLNLQAQDHPVSVLDGPVIKTDTVRRKPQLLPLMGYPVFSMVQMPSFLSMDLFETKEQRAARMNAMASASLMSSLNYNLSGYRPPHLSESAKWAVFAGSLFLSNPFAFPKGAVPMMNTSDPFIYAYTPGWAPYEHPYSPEFFPQSIRVEFDFTTGTYKQVMVKWDDLQKSLADNFGGFGQQYAPIPTDPLRPTYRNTP